MDTEEHLKHLDTLKYTRIIGIQLRVRISERSNVSCALPTGDCEVIYNTHDELKTFEFKSVTFELFKVCLFCSALAAVMFPLHGVPF